MGYFVNDKLGYYMGEMIHPDDQVVSPRPDPTYIWTGSGWAIDDKLMNASNKDALQKTDQGMIRCIDEILDFLINNTPISDVAKKRLADRAALRSKIHP